MAAATACRCAPPPSLAAPPAPEPNDDAETRWPIASATPRRLLPVGAPPLSAALDLLTQVDPQVALEIAINVKGKDYDYVSDRQEFLAKYNLANTALRA